MHYENLSLRKFRQTVASKNHTPILIDNETNIDNMMLGFLPKPPADIAIRGYDKFIRCLNGIYTSKLLGPILSLSIFPSMFAASKAKYNIIFLCHRALYWLASIWQLKKEFVERTVRQWETLVYNPMVLGCLFAPATRGMFSLLTHSFCHYNPENSEQNCGSKQNGWIVQQISVGNSMLNKDDLIA
jgi:hypothetical protein